MPTSLRTPNPRRPLRVMTWNILHGGREDGEAGLQRVIDVIRDSEADVVALQEAYGAGPVIAGALDFHLYQRSASLAMLSRDPILATHAVSDSRRCGGITIEPWPGRPVHVFDVWLSYLPDIGDSIERRGVTARELVRGELPTRYPQIQEILGHLPEFPDDQPVILAGDFNCPSHRDFVESTADRHRGLVVPWPVSLEVEEAGFVDALRVVHPDPRSHPGHTWSPLWQGVFPHRIDYVYCKGAMSVEEVHTLSEHPMKWPSDHAAVLARFSAPPISPRPPAGAPGAKSSNGSAWAPSPTPTHAPGSERLLLDSTPARPRIDDAGTRPPAADKGNVRARPPAADEGVRRDAVGLGLREPDPVGVTRTQQNPGVAAREILELRDRSGALDPRGRTAPVTPPPRTPARRMAIEKPHDERGAPLPLPCRAAQDRAHGWTLDRRGSTWTVRVNGRQQTSTVNVNVNGQQSTSTVNGRRRRSAVDGQRSTSTVDGQRSAVDVDVDGRRPPPAR